MSELSTKAQIGNNHTWQHIHRVQAFMLAVAKDMMDRAHKHDQSKLEDPEATVFAEHNDDLAKTTFDSKEYEEQLESLDTALQHHYARNDHHPEHFRNGIEDMSLFEIFEMMCDWTASAERQHDGNIRKSIRTNADRFDIDPQLRVILENTADRMLNMNV